MQCMYVSVGEVEYMTEQGPVVHPYINLEINKFVICS